MKKTAVRVLIVFMFFFSSCSSPSDTDGEIPPDTSPPRSGEWSAVNTGFGGFDFTINAGSSYITSITYKFSDWRCGSGSLISGNITISTDPGWPITNNTFQIQRTLDPGGQQQLTIRGTFNDTGDSVSGEWEGNVSGTNCIGIWSGSPKN